MTNLKDRYHSTVNFARATALVTGVALYSIVSACGPAQSSESSSVDLAENKSANSSPMRFYGHPGIPNGYGFTFESHDNLQVKAFECAMRKVNKENREGDLEFNLASGYAMIDGGEEGDKLITLAEFITQCSGK